MDKLTEAINIYYGKEWGVKNDKHLHKHAIIPLAHTVVDGWKHNEYALQVSYELATNSFLYYKDGELKERIPYDLNSFISFLNSCSFDDIVEDGLYFITQQYKYEI